MGTATDLPVLLAQALRRRRRSRVWRRLRVLVRSRLRPLGGKHLLELLLQLPDPLRESRSTAVWATAVFVAAVVARGRSSGCQVRGAHDVVLVEAAAIDAVGKPLVPLPQLEPVVHHVGTTGGSAGSDAILARRFAVTADLAAAARGASQRRTAAASFGGLGP